MNNQNIFLAAFITLFFTCNPAISQVDENVFRELESKGNESGNNAVNGMDMQLNFKI